MANEQVPEAPSYQPAHPQTRPPATDADPQSRPGVPLMGESALSPPPLDRQAPSIEVLVSPGRPLTPVFGTSVPPRGLSGAIRRMAYKVPEHKAYHWMLLLLGDRVDVWEHRVRRHPVISIAAVAGVVWLGVARARR